MTREDIGKLLPALILAGIGVLLPSPITAIALGIIRAVSLTALAARHVSVALVNARMSPRSFARSAHSSKILVYGDSRPRRIISSCRATNLAPWKETK